MIVTLRSVQRLVGFNEEHPGAEDTNHVGDHRSRPTFQKMGILRRGCLIFCCYGVLLPFAIFVLFAFCRKLPISGSEIYSLSEQGGDIAALLRENPSSFAEGGRAYYGGRRFPGEFVKSDSPVRIAANNIRGDALRVLLERGAR